MRATTRLLNGKGLYSVSAAAAFLMFRGGAGPAVPVVGQADVCAFDSCKPMTDAYWCTHNGGSIQGYCDPLDCSS